MGESSRTRVSIEKRFANVTKAKKQMLAHKDQMIDQQAGNAEKHNNLNSLLRLQDSKETFSVSTLKKFYKYFTSLIDLNAVNGIAEYVLRMCVQQGYGALFGIEEDNRFSVETRFEYFQFVAWFLE